MYPCAHAYPASCHGSGKNTERGSRPGRCGQRTQQANTNTCQHLSAAVLGYKAVRRQRMQFVKLASFLPSAHEHSAWCSSGKGAWASNVYFGPGQHLGRQKELTRS